MTEKPPAVPRIDWRGADMRMVNLGGAYLDGAMLPRPAAEKQPLLSPSEIVEKQHRQKPEQERGQERPRERDHGRGH
jgi:hypothetical protein